MKKNVFTTKLIDILLPFNAFNHDDNVIPSSSQHQPLFNDEESKISELQKAVTQDFLV